MLWFEQMGPTAGMGPLFPLGFNSSHVALPKYVQVHNKMRAPWVWALTHGIRDFLGKLLHGNFITSQLSILSLSQRDRRPGWLSPEAAGLPVQPGWCLSQRVIEGCISFCLEWHWCQFVSNLVTSVDNHWPGTGPLHKPVTQSYWLFRRFN